jgi:hypothetical protein
MTQFASPSVTASPPLAIEQHRSRPWRYARTLLWLCLTSAVIAAVVLLAPHILHTIHPGPTGGGG